jgi:hypothetical protein
MKPKRLAQFDPKYPDGAVSKKIINLTNKPILSRQLATGDR